MFKNYLEDFQLNFKLIKYNFFFLFIFIFTLEGFLGKWFSNSPALDIPYALVNKNIKYDGSKIYGKGKDSLIKYTRDNQGYRSFNNKKAVNYILTIGGSTTDQRYVPDGYTFQDIIKENLGNKYTIINGGVDGQTSHGHLISIKNWHSKALDKEKVKKVVFLIGVNDHRFVKGLSLGLKEKSKSLSLVNYIRTTKIYHKLSKRSFFYYWIRRIKLKFTKRDAADGITKIGHGTVNFEYKSDKEINNYQKIVLNRKSKEYILLIKNLIIETKRAFPLSNIIVIQQQDPKCIFKKKNLVSSRAILEFNSKNVIDKKYPKLINYCKALGQVYLAQDKAFQELSENQLYENLQVLKMYLDAPVPDDGFYDGIHNNKYGTSIIGKYLLKKIDFK